MCGVSESERVVLVRCFLNPRDTSTCVRLFGTRRLFTCVSNLIKIYTAYTYLYLPDDIFCGMCAVCMPSLSKRSTHGAQNENVAEKTTEMRMCACAVYDRIAVHIHSNVMMTFGSHQY